MTGEMCPSGMGTCRKCGRGERCKPGMGCDGNGDGCSRAELRLDEIARCDRSVDARWPSREIVRLPSCQTMQPPGRGFAVARPASRPPSPASLARAVWWGADRGSRVGQIGPETMRPKSLARAASKGGTGRSMKARIRPPGHSGQIGLSDHSTARRIDHLCARQR